MAAGASVWRRAGGRHPFPVTWLVALLFTFGAFAGSAQLRAQSAMLQHEGRTYVDLASVGGQLGMRAYWLRGYRTFRLRSEWTNIDFQRGERLLRLNNLPVYLGFPTLFASGRLYVAQADYAKVIQPILIPQTVGPKPGFRRIVIDPGHGGRDPGARNPALGIEEKALALDVALRLRALLSSVGFEVVMTRDDDQTVPLQYRPEIANRAGADLFISIHFNAATNRSASGLETFVMTPQFQASSKFSRPGRGDDQRFPSNAQDAWNALLGYHLQEALVDQSGEEDRGLKRARFLVLKHLECPGALVELGFISHAPTARKLRRAAYRQMLAERLYKGIIHYGARLQRIP